MRWRRSKSCKYRLEAAKRATGRDDQPVPRLDARGRQGTLDRAQARGGQTLFRQGDKASAIFEVEQGRVQLIRHTVDDHPVVMHTALPGHLFAEAALFAGAYQCDAIAPVAALVRAYAKRELLASLRADPAMAERFMAALAHQVHALRARLEERNIRSARQRVLHHLSLRAGDDGRTMRLTGTLVELAAEIGLTHEALYRTLAALERDGIVRRTKSAIVLRRRPAL
jgi:CRP-like cAMP-binding protein